MSIILIEDDAPENCLRNNRRVFTVGFTRGDNGLGDLSALFSSDLCKLQLGLYLKQENSHPICKVSKMLHILLRAIPIRGEIKAILHITIIVGPLK